MVRYIENKKMFFRKIKEDNNKIYISKINKNTAKKVIKKLNKNGIMKKGLMIRHLILPNQTENSKQILKWIKENLDNNIYVSIMAQYFPTYKARELDELNRKLTKEEYEDVENYLYKLNLENGYIQELGEHEEEYVPKWDY